MRFLPLLTDRAVELFRDGPDARFAGLNVVPGRVRPRVSGCRDWSLGVLLELRRARLCAYVRVTLPDLRCDENGELGACPGGDGVRRGTTISRKDSVYSRSSASLSISMLSSSPDGSESGTSGESRPEDEGSLLMPRAVLEMVPRKPVELRPGPTELFTDISLVVLQGRLGPFLKVSRCINRGDSDIQELGSPCTLR